VGDKPGKLLVGDGWPAGHPVVVGRDGVDDRRRIRVAADREAGDLGAGDAARPGMLNNAGE